MITSSFNTKLEKWNENSPYLSEPPFKKPELSHSQGCSASLKYAISSPDFISAAAAHVKNPLGGHSSSTTVFSDPKLLSWLLYALESCFKTYNIT